MEALRDQVVLITGCSTGIGRALAQDCIRRGHRVVVTARRVEAVADMDGSNVLLLALDVNDPASVQRAVAQTLDRFGRIDVLVNNAGLNAIGPTPEVPLAALRNVFETNVLGLVSMSQAVFPHMARAGRGRMINIGSVMGLLTTPFAGSYCASKAAVHAISESLRMEAAPFGVDVVVVQPGGVQSEIANNGAQFVERFRQPDSLFRSFAAGIERRAHASQNSPMATDAFARYVLDRALANKPPRVIRAGRGAVVLPALSLVPARVREPLMRLHFGLKKLNS